MKLSLIAFSSLFSLALSQEVYPSIPERANCVARCNIGDFCCVADCHKLLCGNIHDTNEAVRCMAGCPIGVGTPEQVVALSRCREDCILKNYSASSTSSSATSTSTSSSTSSSTGTSSASTTSSSASAETSSSSTSTNTSASTTTMTPTATGSGPEETSNAASVNNLRLGAPATGLFGVLLAFLV